MAGTPGSMTTIAKTAIVLLAHGARDPRWGEPFRVVLERVRSDAPGLAVELAYLEHLAPSLPEAVRRLAERRCPLDPGRAAVLRSRRTPARGRAATDRRDRSESLPEIAIDVTLPAGDDDAVQRSLASFCLRAARGAQADTS